MKCVNTYYSNTQISKPSNCKAHETTQNNLNPKSDTKLYFDPHARDPNSVYVRAYSDGASFWWGFAKLKESVSNHELSSISMRNDGRQAHTKEKW